MGLQISNHRGIGISKRRRRQLNVVWSRLLSPGAISTQGAKTVVKDHDGKLPNTLEGLKAIPGIGDYTAGAIGSIAYKIPTPVVDGNVIRVFSRLKSIAGNPKIRS